MPTLTARYVFPVSWPPLPNGLVTFDGDKIVAVEPAGTRQADVDLGNVAILPGFVNAHTHLDLSGARGLIPPTDPNHFTDWLRGVIAYRRTRTPEQVQQDILDGLNEVLQSGTTLVGDITSGGASYEALSGKAGSLNSPKAGGLCPPLSGSNEELQGDAVPPLSRVRAVVFWELIGLSKERFELAREAAIDWNRADVDNSLCKKSFSPHAPYSVNRTAFGLGDRNFIFASHIAETEDELELQRSHSGRFVDFLKSLGVWDESGIATIDTVMIKSRYLVRYLFVHCNYLPSDCLKYLCDIHTIVYCPRTHASFGHPPHPFREFLARGVRVCLGTDSLASNPDLDILAEARFVRSRYPDFPGSQLLKMITLAGAEALGWADECGSLEPGKSADLVAIPLPDRDEPDPHDLFLKDDSPPAARRTLFRGLWR